MREETVIRTVRACKAAGRKDLVSALRNGALTVAEVERKLIRPRAVMADVRRGTSGSISRQPGARVS